MIETKKKRGRPSNQNPEVISKDKYRKQKNSTDQTVKYHVWVFSFVKEGWVRTGIITGYNSRDDAKQYVRETYGQYDGDRWIITKSVIIESNLVTLDDRDGR